MVIQHAGPLQGMSKEVLYIGSAVPLETSTGLDAIQQPLRSRYPVDDKDIQGIPSILTVLPGGLQLKYIDDPSHVVFFSYSALQLCAAVRCTTTTHIATQEVERKFVSLTEAPESNRPAIFTTITRRTQGRHVLECSGFLTKNPKDALELVQWTSEADMRCKGNGGDFMKNGAAAPAVFTNAHDISSRHDTSFHTELSSPPPPDASASLNGTQNLMPANYDELPKQGYFYTTENAQVKKFSVQKFVRQEGPPPATQPLRSPTSPRPQITEAVPIKINHVSSEDHHNKSAAHIINGDSFDKRSTHSVPVMTRSPRLIAVRGPPPAGAHIMMPGAQRPVLVGRPSVPPHPMMVRGAYPGMVPRPMMYPAPMMMDPKGRIVPMVMPVPMAYPQQSATLQRQPKPARRSSSSCSSSSSTSSRGRSTVRRHASRREHSVDSISRPVTPPRDYDPPRRTSHSNRKDEFNQSRQVNGYEGGSMTLMYPGRQGVPPGYVMMPVQSNGTIYGTMPHPRSKSVPPTDKKSKKKKKKNKDKKKKKDKDKDKHKNNNYLTSSDYPTEGYHSDMNPYYTGRLPYQENQRISTNGKLGDSYMHDRSFSKNAAERAFSNSLRAETTKSARGDFSNAYAMNHNGHADGEFPNVW